MEAHKKHNKIKKSNQFKNWWTKLNELRSHKRLWSKKISRDSTKRCLKTKMGIKDKMGKRKLHSFANIDTFWY